MHMTAIADPPTAPLAEPPRSTGRGNRRSQGFTLVEAIVALAVVSISLAAIGSLTSATLRSGVHVERHLSEMETTQAIVAGMPLRNQIGDGALSGEIAGHRWRIDAEPFPADLLGPGAAPRWTPEKLVLTVQGPGGGRFSLDMIRLIKPRAP